MVEVTKKDKGVVSNTSQLTRQELAMKLIEEEETKGEPADRVLM